MSATTSEKRRASFLAALRATGNHTIAAERARVSRRWVYWRKAHDPAFARECAEALRQAQDRLRQQRRATLRDASSTGSVAPQGERGNMKPPPCWGSQDGEELVVNGSALGSRRIVRARAGQWTPRVEARFLAALAACANVKLALRAVGITPGSAYLHRKRWPDFARRWDAALATGRVNVERDLVAAAIGLLDPELEPPAGLGSMSVAQAITVARITARRGG